MPRPGLSPATVARFDGVLRTAASQWPKDTWVGDESSSLSLNTVAARCRDAIKAVVDGLVPHPTADFLRRHRNDLVVRIDGQNVILGLRPSRVPSALSASGPEAVRSEGPLILYNPSRNSIQAVLTLARESHLKAPVTLYGVSADAVSELLLATDDIAVVPLSETSTSVM